MTIRADFNNGGVGLNTNRKDLVTFKIKEKTDVLKDQMESTAMIKFKTMRVLLFVFV